MSRQSNSFDFVTASQAFAMPGDREENMQLPPSFMQLLPLFLRVGLVLGSSLLVSMIFPSLFAIQLRAGHTQTAARLGSSYIMLQSVVFLAFGWIAFNFGTHRDYAGLGNRVEHFHAMFSGLALVCWMIAGVVFIGGLTSNKPIERYVVWAHAKWH